MYKIYNNGKMVVIVKTVATIYFCNYRFSPKGAGKAVTEIDLNIKPVATNQKLQNIIGNLYKGQDNPIKFGNGTTMDAIKNEIQTGIPTAGKFHF